MTYQENDIKTEYTGPCLLKSCQESPLQGAICGAALTHCVKGASNVTSILTGNDEGKCNDETYDSISGLHTTCTLTYLKANVTIQGQTVVLSNANATATATPRVITGVDGKPQTLLYIPQANVSQYDAFVTTVTTVPSSASQIKYAKSSLASLLIFALVASSTLASYL